MVLQFAWHHGTVGKLLPRTKHIGVSAMVSPVKVDLFELLLHCLELTVFAFFWPPVIVGPSLGQNFLWDLF